jgi:hypothetical protein
MKYFLLIASLIIILHVTCFAQSGWQRGQQMNPPPERLEQFRKMRLIEVLKLNEEESVRFITKQRMHEEKVRDLMKNRNSFLDEIENILDSSFEVKELLRIADKIKSIDNDIFLERQRYTDEMRQFLTPAQFGKFLVFERSFGRQVRDAIDEMSHKRGNRQME